MAESIFTVQTPVNTNANNSPGITLATLFTAAVNGTVSKIRWFWPLTPPNNTVVALYSRTSDAAGTLLATGNAWDPGSLPGQWNTAPLTAPGPVAITAGQDYYAAVFTGDFFVSTVGLFASAGITNGNLTAPQNDEATPRRNGRFNLAGALAYPNQSAGPGNGYFVDVIFDASVEQNVAPNSITLTTSLGAPTVAQALAVVPDGITMSVALGAPTITDTSMAVSPDSITMPVTLGPPTVFGPSAPAHDPVVELYTQALSCLCQAVQSNPNPPLHCVPRIGTEVVYDLGQYTDLCCEGLAYIMLGDTYFSEKSFPEQDIVQQIRGGCAPPTWAQVFRIGLVRCAPTHASQSVDEPPTDTQWSEAAVQNLYDSQTLRKAACCFRNWIHRQSGTEYDGMDVVIGRQTQVNPQGGCVERYVDLTVQFPDVDCACG